MFHLRAKKTEKKEYGYVRTGGRRDRIRGWAERSESLKERWRQFDHYLDVGRDE